mmetsp:Transcript_29654/g.99827  ORF Transcript_29654/g.99827 Transcript_29654/m.99827 type:complete len:215 (-) Transcript_29654:380-1024(-)
MEDSALYFKLEKCAGLYYPARQAPRRRRPRFAGGDGEQQFRHTRRSVVHSREIGERRGPRAVPNPHFKFFEGKGAAGGFLARAGAAGARGAVRFGGRARGRGGEAERPARGRRIRVLRRRRRRGRRGGRRARCRPHRARGGARRAEARAREADAVGQRKGRHEAFAPRARARTRRLGEDRVGSAQGHSQALRRGAVRQAPFQPVGWARRRHGRR